MLNQHPVTVRLCTEEIELLNKEAEQQGVNRHQLLRSIVRTGLKQLTSDGDLCGRGA